MWMDKVFVAVLLTVTFCHGAAIPLNSAMPTAAAPKLAPEVAAAPSSATKRLKREPMGNIMEENSDFVEDEDDDEDFDEVEAGKGEFQVMRRALEGQGGAPEGSVEPAQQAQPSTQTSAGEAPVQPQAGATRPLVLYKMKHLMNPYFNPMLMNSLQQQQGQPGAPGQPGQPGQPRMLMMYKMKHMYPNPMMMG